MTARPKIFNYLICICLEEPLLSDITKSKLEKLYQIIDQNTDLSYINKEILEMEDLIKKSVEISKQEKEILLTATSIARHSSEYWFNNFEQWEKESGHSSSNFRKKKFCWCEVGKNDIAYGVGGGAAGAIVGGSVSLGVLTVPGWVGGAIGGSVGNAVYQLL